METHLSIARAPEPAADAGARMVDYKIGCLPVVADDGRLIGIVTEEDFVRWATERMTSPAA
jgi:CBS domain-containing protein